MAVRKVSESQKKIIAGRQHYKCTNNINNYECPLYFNGRDGSFDEAGYEIDHINELSISFNNDISNLQALCIMCHRVKTKRFLQKPKESVVKRKKFDIELTLWNGKKVITSEFEIYGLENIFIDKLHKIYEWMKDNKFRQIGVMDKEVFIHLFDKIEEPPKRTRPFPPFILNEEKLIQDWELKYGFSIQEYINYKTKNDMDISD